ncbi:TetR/AcrR family transcriptional regulator [Nocardia wallacei]|uniref:TetR/AcrR family transcriptional regulator n=1 Tax=Nocardia wallacei TaxID=480035 RepID=UPI002454FEDD|nr:TetR/AcrR family transcriptional regulator [Nocardia wallacei]
MGGTSTATDTVSSLRERLIDATIQLLSTEGLAALTVRRVSRICDVSTMAIYSNFSGMPGLLRAVGSVGFAQLNTRLSECAISDDPITDILVLGFIFRDEALHKPELFRLMYATESPKAEVKLNRGNILSGSGDSDFENFAESFDHVVRATQRALDAGLIRATNARAAAAQFWTGLYGFIQLDMAGLYGDEGLTEVLLPSIVNILIGMGAEPARVQQSVTRVAQLVLSPSQDPVTLT